MTSPRLSSGIFVAQLTRRVFLSGGFAAVLRSGDESAGAIFIRCRYRNGLSDLLAPASQISASEFGGDPLGGRLFERIIAQGDDEQVEARLATETRFDPDLWIVEIETDSDLEGLLSISAV